MNTESKNIAAEILNQLGGRKFLAMTGAFNLMNDESALTMHLPKNEAKAKFLRIEININDTYNVIFRKQGPNYTFPEVAKFEGVYADMLRKLFTQVTGFETSL